MDITFGRILKEIRKTKAISQRDLADKIDVDFSYISKIENDRLPPPSAELIKKISAALEVSGDVLWAYSGKLDSELTSMLTSSPEAIKFMNQVRDMNLSHDDWKKLTSNLKTLR